MTLSLQFLQVTVKTYGSHECLICVMSGLRSQNPHSCKIASKTDLHTLSTFILNSLDILYMYTLCLY